MKESINWRDRARVLSNKVVELDIQRLELLEALKALLEVQQATEIGFKEREAAITAITKAEGGE